MPLRHASNLRRRRSVTRRFGGRSTRSATASSWGRQSRPLPPSSGEAGGDRVPCRNPTEHLRRLRAERRGRGLAEAVRRGAPRAEEAPRAPALRPGEKRYSSRRTEQGGPSPLRRGVRSRGGLRNPLPRGKEWCNRMRNAVPVLPRPGVRSREGLRNPWSRRYTCMGS